MSPHTYVTYICEPLVKQVHRGNVVRSIAIIYRITYFAIYVYISEEQLKNILIVLNE